MKHNSAIKRQKLLIFTLFLNLNSILLIKGIWKQNYTYSVVVQLLSHVQFLCNPMDYRLPGSSVCGISQARILEWVAISFSGSSSRPRDQTCISCTVGGFFTTEPPETPTHSILPFIWNYRKKIDTYIVMESRSMSKFSGWEETIDFKGTYENLLGWRRYFVGWL